MFPSIESRLPFEGLSYCAHEIFPVTGSAKWRPSQFGAFD